MENLMSDHSVMTIIDDDPGMTSLLSDMAEDSGFVVHAYNDGLLFKNDFDYEVDVILLDLKMPRIDGIELIRFLAQKEYTGHLVLISGYDDSVLHAAEKLAKEQNLNVIAKFSKPLPISDFLDFIDSLGACDTGSKGAIHAGEMVTEDELADAILNKQLVLYYQPQIDIKTGLLVGVEGLVRWQHPEYGLIYPDRFISVAEQFDLIGELTTSVTRMAVEQSQEWRRVEFNPKISINISSKNITSLTLPEQLVDLVNTHSLEPSLLVLEITESALMNELVTSLDTLTRLRVKGFELSIDDFGTGYSSLSQLHRVPFTELKIDKGFVFDMDTDPEALAIVETCVMLGHKLNMKVVAEGVETKRHLDMLAEIGCDILQGYYIAKPMPADKVADWKFNKIVN